jgi:hypothetical protein
MSVLKDLIIPYTLGDESFFKGLYCSVLVPNKNLSFYDSKEMENWRQKFDKFFLTEKKIDKLKKKKVKKNCVWNFFLQFSISKLS